MNERFEYILKQLDEKDNVRVSKLSEQLNCSEVTIRSDIQKLHEKKLLMRTHGGAKRIESKLTIQLETGNIYKNKDNKIKIAKKATEYINDGDTIILDDSSINYYLAKEIRKDDTKHIVVITNSLPVACVLTNKEHISLFLTAGQVGGKLAATIGELTCNSLENFYADKAFISAHGINFDVGITSIGSPQLQVKKSILKVSKKIYALVDSSKFNGGYIMVVCPLNRIEKIITDDEIEDKYKSIAEEKNIDIDIV